MTNITDADVQRLARLDRGELVDAVTDYCASRPGLETSAAQLKLYKAVLDAQRDANRNEAS